MDFKTTAQLEALTGMIGQERADNAMNFGLKIDDVGYNIYVAGETGSGRSTYVKNTLKNYMNRKSNNKDWCYVYNFENSLSPIALSFEPGMGKIFKSDITKLKEDILDDVKQIVDSEEYERAKTKIFEEYERKKENILSDIKSYSKERGFNFKITKVGIMLTPKNEDIDITSQGFMDRKKDVEEYALDLVAKTRTLEFKANEKITALEDDLFLMLLEPKIKILIDKYGDNEKVRKYLHYLKDDIIENAQIFYLDDEDIKALNISMREFFKKYRINLFVDSEEKSPVVFELNPTYTNLFGKIEYESYNGTTKTDFTKIASGAFHRANGGYIILYAEQVLRNAHSWDMIKRCLQSREIVMESYTTLKPEPIPLDVKVILIGSSKIYNLLYKYDEEFVKYFKVIVDFESKMDKNEHNCFNIAKFICGYCDESNLNHFTKDAVDEVIRYSSRLVEDRCKLSTRFNKITELLIESNVFSKLRDSEIVDKEDVNAALLAKWNRINKVEKRMDEMIASGQILIDVNGYKKGVINALSVINMGEYCFGRPSVITVNSSPGNKGIINIEREVELSGAIHDKGVLIISGYLMENFSKENPISLTSTICFEQSYGGIDGDSASSSELYALLSSLSEIPINQSIAATGSVNQKGEIQVVGGVTHKIEGFYNVCKMKGLTGKQGVIIPIKNVDNLVLMDEVEEAIKRGMFTIYPISTIEEGMEILTGKPFLDICEKIIERLKTFHDKSK